MDLLARIRQIAKEIWESSRNSPDGDTKGEISIGGDGCQKEAGVFVANESHVSEPVAAKQQVNGTDYGRIVKPGRVILEQNGRSRVALPMAYVENCISKSEGDFLWRFFEASDFAEGHREVHFSDGTPVGRYAEYAKDVDSESYVRFEIQAYKWVKEYGLGREWKTVAEIFLRMMHDRADISFREWGAYLTNSDDEKIAIGGGQVSLRMLGIRLKDAYRDFFRWYRYIKDTEARGAEPTGHGAMRSFHREDMIRKSLTDFKRARGLETE